MKGKILCHLAFSFVSMSLPITSVRAQCPQDLSCNGFVNTFGVGTASEPPYKFSVSGGGLGYQALLTDTLQNTISTILDIENTSANAEWRLQTVGSGVTGRVGNFEIFQVGPDRNTFSITPDGKFGINTSFPTATLHVEGDFVATGVKSALVETASYGKRQLYAVESPENWFEDFGAATIRKGRTVVKLDPVFAETITAENGYHVFLTPKGDCKGLYVANQTPTSFEVRELQNGKDSVAFDYRIVAKRKGHEQARLAEVRETGKETSAGPRLAEAQK